MIGQGCAFYQYSRMSGSVRESLVEVEVSLNAKVTCSLSHNATVKFGSASQIAVHDNNEAPAEASPA